MLKARFCQLFLLLLLLGGAQAKTIVIPPFSSDDPVVGVALAQAVAEAFEADQLVFGPAVAPTLTPPFLVDGGFFNPLGFHEVTDDPGASVLLRAAIGADLVLNGHLELVDGQQVLQLVVAHENGTSRLTFQGDLTSLARRTVALAAAVLDDGPVPAVNDIDLEGIDGALAEAIHLAVQPGGLEPAREALARPELRDLPEALSLDTAIASVLEGTDEGDPALLAALSLNLGDVDELMTEHYFELLYDHTGLPAAALWQAVLLVSAGDYEAAGPAFEAAAYWPYALANQLAYTGADAGTIRSVLPRADAAALLTYAMLANSRGDLELEKEVLQALSHENPWLVFPFERLSFIALDQNQPLAAAQALAAAVQLDPDGDLYWANLGWSQYLLGSLAESEQSSIRATLLAPGQLVAHYNLGLVRTVTGRLAEALTSYDEALWRDPIVNADAIVDLQDALRLHPGEPGVHYALAYLLEADGQRAAAAAQYAAYARLVPTGNLSLRALERAESLSGPAPELQLPGGVRLSLAGQPLDGAAAQAGDPLHPEFEVYTPGEVLPTSIDLEFRLLAADDTEVVRQQQLLTLPQDTVGFVVDGFTLPLPRDLAAGDYRLVVTVSASEGREAASETAISVGPLTDPLRAVLGYGINMQSVADGSRLFSAADLGHWENSLARLQDELIRSVPAADEVLPPIDKGRFSGMSGGEAFAASTEADIRDFLTWIAHPDLEGSSFVFVDTYAQWVVDGTPVD